MIAIVIIIMMATMAMTMILTMRAQSFVKEMGFSTADSANLKALVSGGAIAGGFVCAELMERYGRRGGIFIICAATPLILLAQSITCVRAYRKCACYCTRTQTHSTLHNKVTHRCALCF